VAAATERVLAALPTPASAPEWLDVAGAAEYLCCSKHRIYRLVSMRRVPHHHEGARVLFNRAELEAWVRAGGAR
jgi:excisionase family DNA binding protein